MIDRERHLRSAVVGRLLRALGAACAAGLALAPGCARSDEGDERPEKRGVGTVSQTSGYESERDEMVDRQIAARGVRDARVLAALRRVPRHRFVPPELASESYDDRPLPIGHRQTISQPYIVAAMSEAIRPEPDDRVLEIGTGSGYQAAVLAELVAEVYTIEIVAPLGDEARRTLEALGYRNVKVRIGDGFAGWPEAAPFDAIVVTAAPEVIPPPLLEQLAPGGRLVIPVGDAWQELRLVTKTPSGFETETLMPVRFVPMTGRAQQEPGPTR